MAKKIDAVMNEIKQCVIDALDGRKSMKHLETQLIDEQRRERDEQIATLREAAEKQVNDLRLRLRKSNEDLAMANQELTRIRVSFQKYVDDHESRPLSGKILNHG